MEGFEQTNNNPEREPSPEGIEKEIEKIAMEKVCDINAQGTAFHFLTPNGIDTKSKERSEVLFEQQEQIKRVLEEGILSGKQTWQPIKDTEEWKNHVKDRMSAIYFNIVGRSCKNVAASYPYFGRDGGHSPIIIFDISKFKEAVPFFDEEEFEKTGKSQNTTHTYTSHAPYVYEKWSQFFGDVSPGPEIVNHPRFKEALKEKIVDENGCAKSNSEYGFELHFRVAPRLFNGLALQFKSSNESYIAKYIEPYVEILKNIGRDNPQLVVPIYLVYGERKKQFNNYNDYDCVVELVWPKRMNAEELTKYLEEKGTT